MSKAIELYFWPTPNGWKISIALEELDLPYVLCCVVVNRAAGLAPPAGAPAGGIHAQMEASIGAGMAAVDRLVQALLAGP